MLNQVSDNGQHIATLAGREHYQRSVPLNASMCKPTACDLRAAVNRVIADNRSPKGPEIESYNDLGSEELGLMLQLSVLSIVQELLENACRHSRSRRILAGIAQDETQIYIQIQDWGIGFNTTAVSPNRRGLKGVRDLVQWLGGSVVIDTQPGHGTCVVVEIPMHRQDG